MSRALEKIRRTNLCLRFLEMGARSIVAAHLSGLTKREVLTLYEEINGERPPRGPLPSSPDWFFRTEIRRIHSSLVVMLIDRLMRETGRSANDLLADAFEAYERLAGDNLEIDINRAWALSRLYVSRQVKLVSCGDCDTQVIALSETPRALIDCPSCHPISE